MYIEAYDPITCNPIGIVDTLNFGDITQYQHSNKPILLRFISTGEPDINDLKIFIENKGSWKDTEIGFFQSPYFDSTVSSGGTNFTYLTEVNNAASEDEGHFNISWDTTSSYYLWIDAQISNKTGISEPNLRFFYTSGSEVYEEGK